MKTWTVKQAKETKEFQQIFRLNYQTFVQEIPQHEVNHDQLLVDFQHQLNTYFIDMDGDELIGMIAVNDERPYSLDQKVDRLDELVDQLDKSCEIRLLAVRSDYRKKGVMLALIAELFQWSRERGHEIGLISGLLKNTPLYKEMGFEAFGPVCGTGEAKFQPMKVEWKAIEQFLKK